VPSGKEAGCSRTTFNLFTKNSKTESVYMRTSCHDAGFTCWETILASLNEHNVSNITKPGHKTSGSLTRWDKLPLHYPFAVKEINQHYLDSWRWQPCFLRAG
jgi:hypothetical protein